MSFGHKVGRGLGNLAAFTVDMSIRGASAAGQFGEDVAAGAQEAYVESSAEREVRREANKVKMAAERAALIAAHKAKMAAPMVPVAEPVIAAPVVATKRAKATS